MGPRKRLWLLVAGVVLAALNLRTAVTSVGALLSQLQGALGMSSAVAGALTTIPVFCFASIGALAPVCGRWLGEHRTTTVALVLLVLGLVVRALTGAVWVFLIASAVALAGGALCNVLLPTLVKRHFGHRLGLMTGVYTTSMAVGTTLGAAVTVPVAQTADSWRVGLGLWSIVAFLAVVPWLALSGSEPGSEGEQPHVAVRHLIRSKLAWAMVLYFGSQAMQAYAMFGWLARVYTDAGITPARAAFLLSLMTALAIPFSPVVPALAARLRSQRPLVVALAALYVVGYVGLLTAPTAAAWLWALLVGIAGGAFPLALTMIGLRTRAAATTAALSAFAQSLGYLLAGIGPLLVGVLHGVTHSWYAPFGLLFAMLVVQLVAGWYAGTVRVVDDDIADRQAQRRGSYRAVLPGP